MSEMLSLFIRGGVFMYPLAGLSIATIAIILERFITEKKWREQIKNLINIVQQALTDKTEITKLNTKDFIIDKKFHTITNQEQELLITEKIQTLFDKRLQVNEVLVSISNSAPLLGFIGTVSGMIGSFNAIAQADRVAVKLVAAGISEALISTGFGLLIAVVCIVVDSYFRFSFSKFSHIIEENINTVFANTEHSLTHIQDHISKNGPQLKTVSKNSNNQ